MLDALLEIFLDLFSWFYNGIVYVASLIPVPAAFAEAEILMQSLPPEVMYWVYLFQIPYGLNLIITSLIARWALAKIF